MDISEGFYLECSKLTLLLTETQLDCGASLKVA